MACDCITTMNTALAGRNTKLSPTLIFGTKEKPGYVTASIGTEIVEKKRGARATVRHPNLLPVLRHEVRSPPRLTQESGKWSRQ